MSSEIPGSGRRPPTIDLTATEVEGAKSANDTAQASASASAETRHSQAGGSVPPHKPSLWTRVADRFPFDPPWRVIAISAGVLIIAAAPAAVWWSGAFPSRLLESDVAERLARIEKQIGELAGRSAPASDTKALGDIVARLAKIESVLAAPSGADPLTAARVIGAEGAAKSAADEVAVLRGRLDELAALARAAQSRADAASAAADSAQKASQSATAEAARAAQADDKAGRRAVAANALRAAVERSEPFAAELATARSLAGDAKSLAELEPFAAQGLPSAAALSRELAALVPAMLRSSSSAAPDASIFDKLQANAERLVRVRPIGDAAGDDPASTIARVEVKISQSDIDGALMELGKLPPAVRAPADAWIKMAGQRKAALAASRQFARDALGALGNPAL